MTEAEELLETLTGGSFVELSREVLTTDPLRFSDRLAYTERLARLQADDPSAEAVRAGFATVGGHEVAVVCSEYEFMAGTLGIAAGERVARVFVMATAARKPVIAVCRSGGTRMQEGTPAFVKMLSIGAAISEHREAGLPYLCYLMDPAMGGALAAWGMQGHLVWAEPGASIAITGPRVVEAVTNTPVDIEEFSAESALGRGLIDDIVPPETLRPRIIEWLDIVTDAGTGTPSPAMPQSAEAHDLRHTDPWQSVARSRSADRPSIETVVEASGHGLIELRGDRRGRDDQGLVAGFARFGTEPAMAIGFRRPDGRGAEVSPGGYHKALRALAIAEELGLALVTLIDTRGAPVGVEAESEGLAHIVGALIRDLLRVRIPTVAVLLGEGSGAGAIALLPADSMVAVEHSWLAPIAPEAASAILFRHTGESEQMARGQAADTAALRDEGLINRVVPEGPTVAYTSRWLTEAIADALRTVGALPAEERLLRRRAAIRSLARQHLTIRDLGHP